MENGFAEGYAVGADRNNCGGGYGGYGMWGGDWIWLIVLFALFGNNGWGGFGGKYDRIRRTKNE